MLGYELKNPSDAEVLKWGLVVPTNIYLQVGDYAAVFAVLIHYSLWGKLWSERKPTLPPTTKRSVSLADPISSLPSCGRPAVPIVCILPSLFVNLGWKVTVDCIPLI